MKNTTKNQGHAHTDSAETTGTAMVNQRSRTDRKADADQNEQDHRALVRWLREGRVEAYIEH